MRRFKNILVLSAPDSHSDALIARSRWLAEANGAMLTVMDVIDTRGVEFARLLSAIPAGCAADVEEQVVAYREDKLERLASTLRDEGLTVRTTLARGKGFVEVIRQVLRNENDLVLKAADRSAARNVLAGPELHLLRKCPCPVWILNSAAEPCARRILAAVDPDPDDRERDALNHQVMLLATSLASRDNARLDVLHAWYLYEESALRSSFLKTPRVEIDALLANAERHSKWRLSALTTAYDEFSERMHIVHVKGIPEDVIVEHAENERIDTLVMGTLGRSGLAGFFIGNTADTVLNRVGCSVVAVKPEGFVSPVTLDDEVSA